MNTPPEVTAAFVAATPRQRALALGLAQGLTKGEAMIAAGYSKAQAKKALPSVVEAPVVATLTGFYVAQAMAANQVDVDRVTEEVCRVVLADIRTAFDENGALKAIDMLPDDIARSIAGIKVTEEFEGYGKDRVHIGYTKELKFWNKLDAVEKLAKIKGWYAPERHVHTINPLDKLVQEVQGNALPIITRDPERTG